MKEQKNIDERKQTSDKQKHIETVSERALSKILVIDTVHYQLPYRFKKKIVKVLVENLNKQIKQ
jgi:hypothetical protein